MKRIRFILSITLILAFFLSACSSPGSPATQQDNGTTPNASPGASTATPTPMPSPPADWDEIPETAWNYEYDSELQGVVLTKYKGKAERVRIPDTVNGDPVVSLHGTFEDNRRLQEVHIPNTVTEITNNAFDYCSRLTSITIPDSVTVIGYNAFRECSGLTSIIIPDSVTSIGYSAFEDCTGLTSVIIPESVARIETRAFRKCEKLSDISILGNTVEVGERAFEGTYWYNRQADGLVRLGNTIITYSGEMPVNTEIVIPEGVRHIAGGAFEGCKGLTKVVIPDSVTVIGSGAFYGCTSLDEASLARILSINPDAQF